MSNTISGSSDDVLSTPPPPQPTRSSRKIKKRKYLRGGCKECKRRKMKCDEAKPFCFNCTRLKKNCVYSSGNCTKKHEESMGVTGKSSTAAAHLLHPNHDHDDLDPDPLQYRSAVPPSTIVNPSRHTTDHSRRISIASGVHQPLQGTVPPPLTSSLSSATGQAPVFRYTETYPGQPVFYGSYSDQLEPDPHSSRPIGSVNPTGPGTSLPDRHASHDLLQQPQAVRFRNLISDILTPSKEEAQGDIRGVFDAASIFVNELSDTINMDLLLEAVRSSLPGNIVYRSSNAPNLSNHPLAQMRDVETPVGLSGGPRTVSGNSFSSGTPGPLSFHLEEFTDHIVSQWNPQEQVNPSGQSLIALISGPRRTSFAVPITALVEETIKENNLVEPHLSYLRLLTMTELSFHLHPFALSIELNEVVHILLEYSVKCPYLLMAILAILATLQYNQSAKQAHDLLRQKYLLVCLTLLLKEFNGLGDKSNTKLANDVERLLLTVLVLALNFTATLVDFDDNSSSDSRSQNDEVMLLWKTHLRGAKDLLINYSTVKLNGLQVSRGLALAKIWFFAIELLAGLMLRLGGTLIKKKKPLPSDEDRERKERAKKDPYRKEHKFAEQNKYKVFKDTGYFSRTTNPEYHDALVRLGLLITQSYDASGAEFNLYLGYTVDVVYMNHEYIKLLAMQREDPNFLVPILLVLKIVHLIHNARESHLIADAIPPTCLIPPDSPAHPLLTSHLTQKKLPESAYGRFVDPKTGQVTVYSWLDILQQIRVDAIYLRLLTDMIGLPKDHHLVRELVDRILKYLFFVRPKDSNVPAPTVLAQSQNWYLPHGAFDIRCIMIQLSFRLIIPFLDSDLDLERLQLFFDGLALLGNGSAVQTKRLFEKLRSRREVSSDDDSEDIMFS